MSEAARLVLIKQWLAEGLGYPQIAERLSEIEGRFVSRNAISGIMYRAGLSSPKKARMYTKKLPPTPPQKPQTPKILSLPPAQGEPEPIGPWNDFPRRGGCQWPHGEPNIPGSRWRMCGHPKAPGAPYCDFHARRAMAHPLRTRADETAARIKAAGGV